MYFNGHIKEGEEWQSLNIDVPFQPIKSSILSAFMYRGWRELIGDCGLGRLLFRPPCYLWSHS